MRYQDWCTVTGTEIRLTYIPTMSQWQAYIPREFYPDEHCTAKQIDTITYAPHMTDALDGAIDKISMKHMSLPVFDAAGKEVGKHVFRVPTLTAT